MKEELEKLGFDIDITECYYTKDLKEHSIYVSEELGVYLFRNLDEIYLFPYNQEKLKQLIKLLS